MGFSVKCLPGSGPSEELLWADTSAFGMCLRSGCARQLTRSAKNKIKLKNKTNLALLIKCPIFKLIPAHTKRGKLFADSPSFLPRFIVASLLLLCTEVAHICTSSSGSLSNLFMRVLKFYICGYI